MHMSSSPRVLNHAEVLSLLAPSNLERTWAYIDVRTPIEFSSGHIEGAFNVPFKHGSLEGLRDNPDFPATMTHCFDPSEPLILGCHSGGRAKAACVHLLALGYTCIGWHADSLAGSRDHFGRLSQGWVSRGLPLTTAVSPGRSYAELLERQTQGLTR